MKENVNAKPKKKSFLNKTKDEKTTWTIRNFAFGLQVIFGNVILCQNRYQTTHYWVTTIVKNFGVLDSRPIILMRLNCIIRSQKYKSWSYEPIRWWNHACWLKEHKPELNTRLNNPLCNLSKQVIKNRILKTFKRVMLFSDIPIVDEDAQKLFHQHFDLALSAFE